MYNSPIELIVKDVQTKIEGDIAKAIQEYGIVVDKEELIKALKYDREQYKKGYADAKAEQKTGKWIGRPIAGYATVRCSVCNDLFLDNPGRWKYCPNCGAEMEEEEE